MRKNTGNKSKSATRPSHHANDSKTAFKNPWPSASAPTWAELSAIPFPLGWAVPPAKNHEKAREIKVVKPDWGSNDKTEKSIIGTWLGHAGVLVQMPLSDDLNNKKSKLWMLFDPIFSDRAGPTQWTGPKRFRQSPCKISDLPGCDAVFISHNHYDHLDLSSIQTILKSFPSARYFVPLGNRRWLLDTGVPKELIYELDWWDNREFSPQGLGVTDGPTFKFTCVPAQHNSGRTGTDSGSTLWCGWTAERFIGMTRKGAVYHAGDTGYRRFAKSPDFCPAFQEIGERLGPFDLSFIPIWRGGSLGFISHFGLRLSHEDVPSTFHGTPTDAVAIHRDVKSRNTVGVHFGTFVGSDNESYEAMIEFAEARKESDIRDLTEAEGVESTRAGTLDIGDSFVVEIK